MNETEARVSVQEFMEDKPAKQVVIKQRIDSVESEEESGLLFVDPEVEKRIQLEKEKSLKKKEMPMLRLKDGSMVPSMFSNGSGPSIPGSSDNRLGQNTRKNYLQNLKNVHMQKRSQNLTLDNINQTFQCTELTADGDDKGKKKAAQLFAIGQKQDSVVDSKKDEIAEEEEEEDDDDFDPEEADEEMEVEDA